MNDDSFPPQPGTLHKKFATVAAATNTTVELWAKPLPNNELAILLVNTGAEDALSFVLDVARDVPGVPTGTTLRDVWGKTDVVIPASGKVSIPLTVHDSFLAVLTGTSAAVVN